MVLWVASMGVGFLVKSEEFGLVGQWHCLGILTGDGWKVGVSSRGDPLMMQG